MADQGSSIPGAESVQQITLARAKKVGSRVLLAGFISAVLPGSGHLLTRRRVPALILFVLFCAVLLGYQLRMPSHFLGLIFLVLGIIALCISSVVSTCYRRGVHNDRPSQWWLVILLPLAFLAASGHNNWMLRASEFQLFVVPSRGMANTIPLNARVIVDRGYFKHHAPARGDIVVYINNENLYLIQRVMAIGGESISGRDGMIFIDGKPIPEPYVIHSGTIDPAMDNFGPITIPVGKMFLMGDNRDVSLDSRAAKIGPIDVANLRGRPLYTISSLQNRESKILR